jgi:hypothetical protein
MVGIQQNVREFRQEPLGAQSLRRQPGWAPAQQIWSCAEKGAVALPSVGLWKLLVGDLSSTRSEEKEVSVLSRLCLKKESAGQQASYNKVTDEKSVISDSKGIQSRSPSHEYSEAECENFRVRRNRRRCIDYLHGKEHCSWSKWAVYQRPSSQVRLPMM